MHCVYAEPILVAQALMLGRSTGQLYFLRFFGQSPAHLHSMISA